MGFIKVNPNPVGNKTGDCVIRALSIALDMPWEEVYAALFFVGLEMGDWGNNNAVWGAYLRRNGFKRYIIPNTCPDCYTVKDFCHENRHGTYILATGSHVIAVKDGDYYDAWDSGDEVPIYYWKRKEYEDAASI